MAKRLLDTDFFKKQSIRRLSPKCKLFFFYVITDCDHAGIWECDFEVASIRIGMDVTEDDVREEMGDRIIFFDGGKRMFVPAFIEHQYGVLNPDNRVHKSAIDILKKHDLYKTLTRPLEGSKDIDKDKDKDKDNEKDKDKKGGAGGKQLTYPHQGKDFMEAWGLLVTEPKWRKKTHQALQTALNKLGEVTERDAISAIHDAIAGGWQGIFPKQTTKKHDDVSADKFKGMTAENYWNV